MSGYGLLTDHDTASSDPPDGQPIGLRAVLLLGAVLSWRERLQPRDRPVAVSVGSRTKALLDRANELALQGREDDAAVAELVTLARGKRRTLRQARNVSRFWGLHREHRHANRVYRLLDGACSGGHVPAVDREDNRRIEEVEAMLALPRAQRWALLLEREPRLREIEEEVRSGSFGRLRCAHHRESVATGETHIGPDGRARPVMTSSGAPFSDAESQELRETANNATALHRRVSQLVGPDSAQQGLLLGSTRAQNAAEDYLMHCAE